MIRFELTYPLKNLRHKFNTLMLIGLQTIANLSLSSANLTLKGTIQQQKAQPFGH